MPFSQKSCTIKFSYIHNGDKSFKCNICSKPWSQKGHWLKVCLSTLVKDHSYECSKSFFRKSNVTLCTYNITGENHLNVRSHQNNLLMNPMLLNINMFPMTIDSNAIDVSQKPSLLNFSFINIHIVTTKILPNIGILPTIVLKKTLNLASQWIFSDSLNFSELIYLYFPPSFHLTVGCFYPVGLLLL